MLAALAAVGAAVAIALVAADRQSSSTLDAPAGGIPEPRPELDIVIDEPTGGREPRGLVWVLCCGAWRSAAAHGVDLASRADRRGLASLDWTRRGYRVATFASTGGAAAVEESLAAFDRLREEHPDLSICAFGGSAAGHMALMVAAQRPELSCVIAHSSPSSLADLPDEAIPGVLPEPPLSLARDAFGAARMDELSPLRRAGDIAASVRLVACSEDRIVPVAQSRRLARALRRRDGDAAVELAVLPGESVRLGRRAPRGSREVIHRCFVSERRIARAEAATAEFVERALAED
ncbi:MAG: prolyl oligopeptidase family serine peptidase [Thermoleophilaceae bacterium]